MKPALEWVQSQHHCPNDKRVVAKPLTKEFIEQVQKDAIASVSAERDTANLSLALAHEALSKIKPETDCPFCKDNEPCGTCYTMATVQGKISHILKQLPATAMLKQFEDMKKALENSNEMLTSNAIHGESINDAVRQVRENDTALKGKSDV